MKIKQKVMKAWAAGSKIELTVFGETETGFIDTWNMDGVSFRTGNTSTLDSIRYDDITDIRFVGEEEVDLADEGSIMGDFQKERTRAVSEMFDNPDPETSIYPTLALYARLDGALEAALERQRDVIAATLTIKEPWVEAEEAALTSMPYDFVRERLDDMSESFGNVKYVKLEYAKNAVSEAEEKSRNAEPDPPAEDIASECWEWEEFATHSELYQIGVERDECGIATLHMATDAQKALMAAAPELADELESVLEALAGMEWRLPDSVVVRAKAALCKARGK